MRPAATELEQSQYASRLARAGTGNHEREALRAILAKADISIGGDRPWDFRPRNPKVFSRILRRGSLGLGDSYVDGWWECEDLDQFFFQILSADLGRAARSWKSSLASARARLLNLSPRSRAFEVAEKHYNLGNDLFQTMLDRRMTYSCGYWKEAKTLDAAQEAKLDLVCRKVKLRPGMRVLDIGCGWGSFAIFAAQHYGVSVTGVTVSEEQRSLAAQRGKDLPVEFRLEDYRDLREEFDAVVSIGMFEHVGDKNYETFFNVARRCLQPEGLFLLHSIGTAVTSAAGDPWISRHIFPNSHIPSMKEISAAIEEKFIVEDWQNFGADYARTLRAWEENFRAGWENLKANYDERFYRKWRYYLLSCAGSFRARYNQLWQIVLSKKGVPGGYVSVR